MFKVGCATSVANVSLGGTDYFLSCETGGVERFEVIDRHGNVLPEMKRWNTVHEYDRAPVN